MSATSTDTAVRKWAVYVPQTGQWFHFWREREADEAVEIIYSVTGFRSEPVRIDERL